LGTLGRKDVFRKALFEASLEALHSGQRLPASMEVVSKGMQLFGPARLDDDAWARQYLRIASENAPRDTAVISGLLGQQAATTNYDDRLASLAGIGRPVLVVGFELDLLDSAKLTREVADVIHGASYIEIPGCGHGGPWEQPAIVNEHLLAYLSEHA
jgi:pimeloyl-ACP methyl ester carboxylesterase